MNICTTCQGFVPQTTDNCPNCTARAPSRAARLAAAALLCGSTMTLMACYGAPGGEGLGDACLGPRSMTEAPLPVSDGHDLSVDDPGCGPAVDAEATAIVFSVTPRGATGAGRFTALWSAPVETTVTLRSCDLDSSELSCAVGSTSGSVSAEVDVSSPVLISFHGLTEEQAAEARLRIEFEPFCGDSQIQSDWEQCDDGNRKSGDGCDERCQDERAE